MIEKIQEYKFMILRWLGLILLFPLIIFILLYPAPREQFVFRLIVASLLYILLSGGLLMQGVIRRNRRLVYGRKREDNHRTGERHEVAQARLLDLGESGGYLDTIAKKTTQLYLLDRSQNLEIIKQDIEADKMFMIKGVDERGEEGGFEFFYILRGEIRQTDEEKTLGPGHFITTRALDQEIYYKTLTPVSLLYITDTPVFAHRQEEIRRLLSLSREVAEKDRRTEAHCDRLQDLALRTGEELGLDEDELFPLVYASFLHDIGKVRVPEEILTKEGELSEEEWDVIRRHPAWGQELILESLDTPLFECVGEIVCQHHERFDGTGYPRGLQGEEILIQAQIVSIVDAYDAMISERPYQEALGRDEVRRRLEDATGIQFDLRVVEAFLRVEERLHGDPRPKGQGTKSG